MNTQAANMACLQDRFKPLHDVLQKETWNPQSARCVEMGHGVMNIAKVLADGSERLYYQEEDLQSPILSWINNISNSVLENHHVLVYGLGSGYHLRALLNSFPNKWFYVYEPDLEFLKAAVQLTDLTDVLSHPNVISVAGGASIEQKRQLLYPLFTYAQARFAYITASYYSAYDTDGFQQFKAQLPTIYSEYKVNRNTLERFKSNWMENRLNHLSTNVRAASLSVLHNRFEQLPAIIVGSGPSLQEDIEYLRKVRSSSVLIAAGSSVQALLHHGIRPHIVVLVDGGRVVENIFRTAESRTIPLIYVPTANFKVTDIIQSPKFRVHDRTDRVSSFFDESLSDDPSFSTDASVTGAAVQAAAYIGCKQIVFAGQDFSFPSDEMYSAGVKHIPSAGIQKMIQAAEIAVENVNGGINRTTLPYKVLLQNIEHLISAYKDITFINTSRLGAQIAGAPFKLLEEIFVEEEAETSINVDQMLETFKHYEDPERAVTVKNRIEQVQTELQDYSQQLNDLAKKIKQLPALSRTNPAKCANLLVRIETQWSDLVNRQSFVPLFETMCPTELNEFDQQLPSIVQEQNLIKKCQLIETHLLNVIQQLHAVIPTLKQMCHTAILRFDRTS